MKGASCSACHICTILLIVGGINWGLVGIADINLVNLIFGSVAWLESLVYILVGVAAIGALASMFGMCKNCCKGGSCAHKH